MTLRRIPNTFLGAALLGLLVAAATAWLGLRAGDAEAQGIMATPACQCSAPTSIPNLSTNLVHCLCGGMSCVLSTHSEQGRSSQLMQCVR